MTESCICGVWKKHCPRFTVDYGGFDLSERFSEEHPKCLELARTVGLNEIEEEDVNSLLETIGEELSAEDLNELEKQRCQLEEGVEAEQHPTASLTTKQLTVKILQHFYGMLKDVMDYLEEVDPDVERAGLSRRKVMVDLAH